MLIRAFNPYIYSAAVVPVLVGAAAAFYYNEKFFDPALLGLTLLGVFFAQLGINLQNDYFDFQTGVDKNKPESFVFLFSKPKTVIIWAWIFFLAASGIGVYLDRTAPGHTVLILFCSGGILAYFYAAPPLRLSFSGAGELVTFICFGPLATAGSYFIQAHIFNSALVWISVPVGLLCSAILFVHHFSHYQTDREYKKLNLVARFGPERALKLIFIFFYLPFFIILLAIFSRQLPAICALSLLTFPLAQKAINLLHREVGGTDAPGRAKKYSIGLHFMFGISLTIGFSIINNLLLLIK